MGLGRWRSLLTLAILLLAGPASVAQVTWLAEPGRGVGPLILGMSREEVVAMIGAPTRISDISVGQYLLGKSYQYNTLGLDVSFDIEFTPQGTRNLDFGYVTKFEVWGRVLKTRGGVGVGSTLAEVIRVFGDTSISSGRVGDPLRLCVLTNVFLDASTADVRLYMNYLQQGIAFDFSSNGVLRKMTILKTSECWRVQS